MVLTTERSAAIDAAALEESFAGFGSVVVEETDAAFTIVGGVV